MKVFIMAALCLLLLVLAHMFSHYLMFWACMACYVIIPVIILFIGYTLDKEDAGRDKKASRRA